MKTIEFNRSSYKVAEYWGELTPDQYRELIMCPRLVYDESEESIDQQAAACRVWLGMSAKKWRDLVLTPWQWGQLRLQFNWLFKTRPTGKPPINSFAHKGRNYHLPTDGFADTSSLELAVANMAYLEFASPIPEDANLAEAQAERTSALTTLVAILCRPRRADWRKHQRSREWNGDVREPFVEARMMQETVHLFSLPLEMKLLVLDYFERMNNDLLENYAELFGGSKEPRYGDGRGWLMLLKNVAKDGTFGDFDKECSTPATLLFATLLDDMLDSREAAEKQANQTPIQ